MCEISEFMQKSDKIGDVEIISLTICMMSVQKLVESLKNVYSLARGVQLAYGSPSKPSMHEHIGWWFCVVQRALKPHAPMHGSWHCWPIQARLDGHSWWITHSGRQFGGAPSIPNEHEQTARFSIWWHSLFGPHGDGIHGLMAIGGSNATKGTKRIMISSKNKIIMVMEYNRLLSIMTSS